MADVKILVIDRSKWLRGGGPGTGKLRDDRGRMCAVGFLGRACGVSDIGMDALYPVPASSKAKTADANWPTWLFPKIYSGIDGFIVARMTVLATINDDERISDNEREQRLTEEFARDGVTLRFVGPEAP